MTDTQAHPDGGSRAEGPLSSITDSDREAVRRTEEAPHKCHDILACHDLLVTEADRLRQQNAELREALERLLAWELDQDAFHDRYGRPEYEDSSIGWEAWRERELRAPARAALDRSQP